MRSGNQPDPFADLGNLKLESSGSSSTKPSRPQTTPQSGPAMTNRPAYQHYNQKPPHTPKQQHQQPARATAGTAGGQPQSAAGYQPNYSSSVLGGRDERGPRPKTGQPHHVTHCSLALPHTPYTVEPLIKDTSV